jgi:hypothetical protein
MAEACQQAGIHRILVVGGAPSSHKELKNLQPDNLEFKLIPGDLSRDRQRAVADLGWCDLAVIWAGTILGHDVSNQYHKAKKQDLVVVNRRSVEALCEAVVRRIQGKMK